MLHKILAAGTAASLGLAGSAASLGLAGTAASLGLAGSAVAAVSSGPRLSPPQRIIASEPNVPTAVNGAGQAVTLRPGSGPGPALQLTSPRGPVRTVQLESAVAGYNDPSVAIGESGAVAATWDTSSTSGSTPTVLEMAAGSFSSPPTRAIALTPASAGVTGGQVFVNPKGTAIVLWDEIDAAGPPTVRAAIVASGTTPTPVTLDAGATYVGAGFDAGGSLVVIERNLAGFVARPIASDGTIGAAQAFTLPSAAHTPGSSLTVVVDGAGDQLYSWASSLGAHQQLTVDWRSAAGTLAPAQTLGADVAGGGGGGGGADVALNASGHAVAVLEPTSTGPLRVRFARRLGRFTAAQQIGKAGRFADMPVVAIDGAGRTLLAWLDSPRASRGTSNSRELVAQAHGTRLTPPELLPVQAGLGHEYLSDTPLVAADPTGRAALVTYGASSRSRAVGQLAFLLG